MVSLVPLTAIVLVLLGTYFVASDMVLEGELYEFDRIFDDYSHNSMMLPDDGYLDGDQGIVAPRQVFDDVVVNWLDGPSLSEYDYDDSGEEEMNADQKRGLLIQTEF